MPSPPDQPLRILHAVRPPVGGIFRHILDLANGQVERGHQVGIIADSLTGGERADKALAEIAPRLKLGVHRLPIRREPWPSDVWVWLKFMWLIRAHEAGRAAWPRRQGWRLSSVMRRRSPEVIRVYTPHGGSLHYGPQHLQGRALRPPRALR